MINIIIDEMTPCLKDSKTGEILETEVIRIKRKSFLSKYNTKTGWYVNWNELVDTNEVYALVIKGTVDIQGLVAIKQDKIGKAVYITWMCSIPENNKLINKETKYLGIGGHLFEIAIDKSIKYNYDGYVYGFAANKELLDHYIKLFGAEYIGMLHKFHFAINEENALKIKEIYNYEWTDEEI